MKKQRSTIFTFLVSITLLALPGLAIAQPSVTRAQLSPPNVTGLIEESKYPAINAQNVELVGHMGGFSVAVFVQGNYAYIGEGLRLTILDISNPATPNVIGKTAPLAGLIRDIYVSGSIAYVASGSGGLQVIDISSPTAPTRVGAVATLQDARGVYVSGNTVYVADGQAGLQVIDASNPANPMEIGGYDTPVYASGVYVVGTTAYVADGDGGLRIVDVSNPVSPAEVGYYDTLGEALGVYVSDSIAYLAVRPTGLELVDVSDPISPTRLGVAGVSGYNSNVYVSGNSAYLASGNGGFWVIDVSDPTDPSVEGSYDSLPGGVWDVYISSNTAYLPDGAGGLRSIDVSNPTNPAPLGFYDAPGPVLCIYVSGNTAYLADGDDSLRVADVGNPAAPVALGKTTPFTQVSEDLYASGGLAYMARGLAGLRIIDVSSPANPLEVGDFQTSGYAHGVYTSGNTAYLAAGDAGLRVIDVSNPANPTEIGSYTTPSSANGVYVSGSIAYVASSFDGLRVVDISTPSTPVEIGSVELAGDSSATVDVHISGNAAFVVDLNTGLHIIDVTNPTNPIEVGSIDTPGSAETVSVSGSLAFVADGATPVANASLRMIDVSDPAHPTLVGSYELPGATISDVYASGDTIFVAGGAAGLLVLRYAVGPTYAVSGRVLDEDSNPIPGVTISDGAGHTATTGPDGAYVLSGLPANTYTITPSKSGYDFSPPSRTVTVPPDATGQDFLGTSPVNTYSISGRVVDAGQNPIPAVSLSNGAGRMTVTNSQGEYTFGDLPEGSYTITPSKSGYNFSPPSQTVSVPPSQSLPDFVGALQLYSISGRVTDANAAPVAGVTISDGQGHADTTDASGDYILEDVPAGLYTIRPSTDPPDDYTFSPDWYALSLPPDQTERNFTARALPGVTDPEPEPEEGKPWVYAVEPCIGGPFYLRPDQPVPHRYEAQVDWQGLMSDHVDFTLNGVTASEPTSGATASHTYDLGQDFNYEVLGAKNTLEVRAAAGNGTKSPAYRNYPIGVESAPWLFLADIDVTIPQDCVGDPMKAAWNIDYPEPPFSGTVKPPDWFPLVGGHTLGIKETQAGVGVELAGDGIGSAELTGRTGFVAAGQDTGTKKEGEGSITGKGEVTIQEDGEVRLDRASFNLKLAGAIQATQYLVDVICDAFTGGVCPLEEAENIFLVGEAVKWFNERAKLQGDIEPSLDLTLNFRGDHSGLQWESGTGAGKVRLTLTLILEAIKDYLTATMYGGGEPSIIVQSPPNPSYLKELTMELFAGLKFTVWAWESDPFEVCYECLYEPGNPSSPKCYRSECGASANASQVPGSYTFSSANWHPLPRDYASDANTYTSFRANDRPFEMGSSLSALGSGLGVLATEEHPIATNVFPEGHPAVAADDSLLLLWVHDDVSKPQMQGEEIYYSVYNGATWSVPAGVTNDNLQDFAPQVAFDAHNKAVIVWERNKMVQSESSDFNAEYTNAFEIAYAIGDSSGWSTPLYLTNDNTLDHAPILTQGNDGTLLLIWRQNAAGELLGTTISPDTLFYALWDGVAWSTPQILLHNAGGVLGLTAARHNANTMAVVYSQDTDGDLGTSEDQELYSLVWDGADWGDPIRLTNDVQPDNHPTFLYDPSGNPRLLWLKDDTLYALLDSLTGTPRAVAVGASAAMLDYAAAQDNAGNLVLLWQGYSEEGVDAFYAAYDETHDVFSLVEQLTHDEPLEKFMAPAFAPSGEMVMAYNKTALVTETVTVSPTLSIENVTTFGQTDLYVLRHTFGPDLALEGADLVVEPVNPTLGSTAQLSATLHNAGDRAVANPEVTFYLGNPSAGGTPIDTATANLTLAGGMTTTLSIDYSVPTSGGPFPIYVVADPNDAVAELDEANNRANFFVSVPDLTPEWVRVSYGGGQEITLTATLSNTGVVPATPCAVTFRLNDPVAGPVVAVGSTPSLEAGTETEIQATWDASSTPTGRYLIYAVADPDDAVVEADETNNDEWAGVSLLPDLVLRSTGVLTGYNGTNLLVSVWVFNEGQRDANGVTLGLYNQLPKSDTTPLVSTVLDIPAGEHRVATLNMGSYSRGGFYAGVGISGELEDRDVSNNILLVGQAPTTGSIYLPIIFKAAAPPAPDLLVTNLVATSHAVTVTIKNQGDVPTSAPFWVDVYFNPSVTPGLNQPWDTIASHGVVWGVTASIPADGTLTLTTSDADPYYFRDYSSPAPLPVGANVYAMADSVDFSTPYGAVRESNENNNLLGPVTSTAAAGEISPSSQSQPRSAEGLPPRR